MKLSDDEEVRGVVEYYDQRFIRVTRTDAPNLFIFKHDIKYLYEVVVERAMAIFLESAIEIAHEAGSLLRYYFERHVAFRT